ncbi:MAG: thioredoxin-dependent thiol peroxidase [Saprospirales bacterium]|jgi:peroxiredoxin Q/BCP|nr:thioredoxin-dependent thiol peroxidase [Saprospirales bacterium]MBK6903680.1 thioredoxin-dependent thiol peroxidase [Saprospirales bacterium]MBK7337438.1 thioredoxin-dependent thiol peroxidase [Saprospirales bacterium]
MTHLKEGDKAPAFSGLNENGEPVSLSDYKGKKLILFFYPQADTTSCTAEACSLRDHYAELREQGFDMLGVSPDAPKSQLKFKDKYQFPFHLLADKERKVLGKYGVWGPKIFFGKNVIGVLRTTFVIDEKGRIERIFGRVNTKKHALQILESYRKGT